MIRFLIRRIFFGIIVMWVVATAIFLLYFVAKPDPARTLAGKNATTRTINEIRVRLGLNHPILWQYVHYLGRLLHGNLGYSYQDSESVNSIIAQGLAVTASLAIGAAVLWIIMGVSSGVLAATRPRSIPDRSVTGAALFFYSMPTFLLGEIFLLVFFYEFHLAGITFFPGGGYVPLTEDPWQWFVHLLLPWFTLALVTAATYSRLTRGSMLDVMGEDYIRTARAKGLSERRVTYRHGLRSALTPVVTQFGVDIGTLLGGVVITETVFSLPGLGQRVVNAIGNQDLPVIIGITLVASAFVILANIVVDAFYAVLDPRVRLS
jgi:peptide/nickel transport system permease protein